LKTLLQKKILPRVDPDIVTAARMGLGSAILLAAAAIVAPASLLKTTSLTSVQWMWLIISSATLLGYVMSWYRALRLAPATAVTSVLVAATLVTNVLSALFVTHKLTMPLVMQAVLMLVGIGLIWVAARKDLAGNPSLAASPVIENE
jgi:uncharacterized membrane protein